MSRDNAITTALFSNAGGMPELEGLHSGKHLEPDMPHNWSNVLALRLIPSDGDLYYFSVRPAIDQHGGSRRSNCHRQPFLRRRLVTAMSFNVHSCSRIWSVLRHGPMKGKI